MGLPMDTDRDILYGGGEREGRFLSLIFSSIQDGISVLDTEMRIVRVNPAMEKWYSHAMPLVGKKCYEAYHSRQHACEVCPVMRTLRTREAANDVVPRTGPGGKVTGWLDLFSFPVMDPDSGRMSGVIEYVRDITERRLAEERLEAAALRLAVVIDRVDEGITLSDEEGHLIIYNSKMGDITGYTMQEANAAEDFLSLICADPEEWRRARQRLVEVIGKGDLHDAEMVIRMKNRSARTLLVSTSIMHPREGRMFLSVYRDISAFKEMDKLKDEFVSMVSHELRTPLSIIKEGVNLVLDGIPGAINSEQAKVLGSTKRNIDRLVRIINNLLDISKIEAGKLEMSRRTCDVSDVIRQAVSSFSARAGDRRLKLEAGMPDCPIVAEVDPDMIAQVVSNLIDNAIKFTDEGKVSVTLKRSESGIEISVEDTGIGIAKEDMGKLFGKFQQFSRSRDSGEKGTGLGLSIAKGMIEMHGGRMWAESKPGAGTIMKVAIPIKGIDGERGVSDGK